MSTYKAGTKVFCDFHFGGKPRGIVLEVLSPGDGKNKQRGEVRVKLTESAGAYRKGELLTVPIWQAVPVKQEFRKAGSCFRYVNTDYCFA